MRNPLPAIAALAILSTPAVAQQWSVGVATGPFVFGDLAERTVRAAGGGPGNVSHLTLTAKIRPGIAADIERELNERFMVRLEGTFTSSPLAIESGNAKVGIDAGKLDVSSWTVPLMIRLNPHGTFRFHVGGGPAYAIYHIRRRAGTGGGITPFRGTRSRFGGAAAAGVEWSLSERLAIEGEVQYIRTSSPFRESDFVAPELMHIPQPQHTHTTAGVRWRF